MDKENDKDKPVADKDAGKNFASASIKNAHAAGDGALEKDDEQIENAPDSKKVKKQDPPY
jgi:hypothetical protein